MADSYADGAGPVLGKPLQVMQVIGATGSLYDADRDVLMFMPYMLQGIALAMRDRKLPAIAKEFEDPAVEQAAADAFFRLASAFQNKNVTTYQELVDTWRKEGDERGVDVLLKILGRGVLQFYVETAQMVRSPANPLPGAMEKILLRIHNVQTERSAGSSDSAT